MVQRQVAGGLENKRLKVLDGALAEGTGDAQVGLLQQVFGGARVINHALQGAQQADSLGEKYSVELGLTHSDTRAMRSE
ncbi:hypothetical protein D3C80_2084970 [compost metagenome]